MSRIRKPYTLTKISGRKYWYYYTYDQYGRRSNAKSTGETSKTTADAVAKIKTEESLSNPKGTTLFKDWAANWWIWSKCDYVQYKLDRATKNKTGIRGATTDENRRILEQHILPAFEKLTLSEITPIKLEKLL